MSVVQRRQEEKERRRASILDAAEAVFAEREVERATMGDVARRARLSRSLLYFYFRDKDELYHAVTLKGLRRLRARLEAAADEGASGMDRVVALVRAYAHFAWEEPHCFEAISRLAARGAEQGPGGRYRQAAVREGEEILRWVAGSIQDGRRDGSIRADARRPFAAAVALWGLVHGLVQVLAQRDRPVYGVAAEELLEEAVQLVRRGFAAP